MKRTAFKRKTAMARGTSTLKRGKPMGPGKKTKAKAQAISLAVTDYFFTFGTQVGVGIMAPCQLTGRWIGPDQAIAHHKTPRSELRKQGVEDLDAPHRLLICSSMVHLLWLHRGAMGRPKLEADAARFLEAELSPANAETGGLVEWSEQYRLNLERFLH